MRGSTSEKSPLNRVRSGGYGGTTTTTTTLLASLSDNTNINYDVEEGGVGVVGDDNVVKPQTPKDTTREWFGQLVAIITGKKKSIVNHVIKEEDGSSSSDNKADPKQSYRDKAEAFLKKTEVERMKQTSL